jgi:hypothetical protein
VAPVSPFQFGAALATLGGALLAISARDTRLILGGLVLTLGLAPLIADPLPSPIAIAVRLAATLLGAELLAVVLRGSATPARNAPLGPVSPALAAAAACLVGYATSGVGSPTLGPPLATALGFGLATIALGPLLLGRDVLRIGLGMALLVTAAELIRTGLAGTPGPLEQLVSAGLTIALLGAMAAIAANALASEHDLSVDGMALRETLFEAHPLVVSQTDTTRRSLSRRRPAAGPRRNAAAHQLTLEERLRLTSPAETGAHSAPPAEEDGPAPTGGDQPR